MSASLAATVEAADLTALRAVVLPDLFIDHFVTLERWDPFVQAAKGVHQRGGGNVITGPHAYRIGGNAANTAYALGRLGVPTSLLAATDALGAHLAQTAMAGLPVDLSSLAVGPRASSTVALEFHEEERNVMLSDPGPLADFGPNDIPDTTWEAVEAADAVVVTNWSQTLMHGTHLLEEVTRRAQRAGAFTFLDTGDPTHRPEEGRQLLEDAAALRHVSAWGMNENELAFFARAAGSDATGVPAMVEAVQTRYPGRLDVHTWSEVLSRGREGFARAGTFMIEPLRLTGSGDAWNAGNLLGQLLEVGPTDRLALANAVAALAITSTDAAPPDRAAVVRFLKKRPVAQREPV